LFWCQNFQTSIFNELGLETNGKILGLENFSVSLELQLSLWFLFFVLENFDVFNWIESHDGLIGGIIGAVGVIVAVYLFWTEEKRRDKREEKESKDRICRSCNAILMEISDHKELFQNPNFTHIRRNGNIDYTIAFFNTEAFESILHSGLFTHLNAEIQNRLSNIYVRIKLHNEFVKYRAKLRDMYNMYDKTPLKTQNWISVVKPYEESLTNWEQELKLLIAETEVLLNKEIN